MDIKPILDVLVGFGVSVSANAVYDFFKGVFSKNSTPSVTEFESALQSFLQVHKANVAASDVISVFASQGLLNIQQSGVHLIVEGEINVAGEDAENVTGIDGGGKTTILKPGTIVNVSGKRTKNVIGVKN